MTRWLALSLVVAALAIGATGYVWFFQYDRLLEQVPVHWNLAGEADQYSPRADAWHYLIIGPIALVVIVLLTLLLPWLSPGQFNVERFRPVFDYVMALVVILMGYIQVILILASFGQTMPLVRLLLAGIFLFFALIGNVLGQVRRNFWMGVRTPWTLASEKVWNATHRLSAWLYLAVGIVGFLAVLAGVNLVVCGVVFFSVVLFPVFYSLVLYKRLERQGQLE